MLTPQYRAPRHRGRYRMVQLSTRTSLPYLILSGYVLFLTCFRTKLHVLILQFFRTRGARRRPAIGPKACLKERCDSKPIIRVNWSSSSCRTAGQHLQWFSCVEVWQSDRRAPGSERRCGGRQGGRGEQRRGQELSEWRGLPPWDLPARKTSPGNQSSNYFKVVVAAGLELKRRR